MTRVEAGPLAALIEKVAARRAQAAALASNPEVRFEHPRSGWQALAQRDVHPGGAFRLTHLDSDAAPVSHGVFPTMELAVFEALQNGYRAIGSGAGQRP